MPDLGAISYFLSVKLLHFKKYSNFTYKAIKPYQHFMTGNQKISVSSGKPSYSL